MRGTSVLPAGSWDGARETDCVRADHDQRHRRRILLHTEGGREVLLDLAQARQLRDGDGIVCEDGGVVRVVAIAERLLEITAATPGGLLRLAWHLGNRHLPVSLGAERLLIREDHVIAEMVRGLGGVVREIDEPFDPEVGAYDSHKHSEGSALDPSCDARVRVTGPEAPDPDLFK